MIRRKKKAFSLETLEYVFALSLELKSKCLIQACVITAEQEFSGVSSFSQCTQLKFLFESIRQIVQDNCQKEYIHILHYLESVNSHFEDVSCQEEFTRSMLKLKQSFVLYNILENGSVSDVCFLVDQLFPVDSPLKGMHNSNSRVKRRFLSTIRRDVFSFKMLVNKLLTDMEYRQYYFFEEYFGDYGEQFHKELLSDLNSYLQQVDKRLTVEDDPSNNMRRWENVGVYHNPALVYFLKLLTDMSGDFNEVEILRFLRWMFPTFDDAVLTMPIAKNREVPENFRAEHFDRILSKSICAIKENPPWKFDNFDEVCEEIQRWNQTIIEAAVKTEPSEYIGPVCFSKTDSAKKCLKVVLSDISNVKADKNTSQGNTDGMKTPMNHSNVLRRDLENENDFVEQCDSLMPSKQIPGFDTPQSRTLLNSGSKFFSPKIKQIPLSVPIDLSGDIMENATTVHFSDEETEVEPSTEIKRLQWLNSFVTTDSTPKSARTDGSSHCRTLSFESSSSDCVVSESDIEGGNRDEVQPIVQMLDNSFVPDLSWYLTRPETKPCMIKLQRLSDAITEDGTIFGNHINADDLKMIHEDT